MAGIEHEDESAMLPLVVEIAKDAKNAYHAHEFLDGGRVVIIIQPELFMLFGEAFRQLFEPGPHRKIVHRCLYKF